MSGIMRNNGVDKELEKFSVSPMSSTEMFMEDFCKSKYKKNVPGCECYAKSEVKIMKSGCMNTPCTDISCLKRKLKETQEFVNSLGKIPGMQGLGLMDPTESPFFNRKSNLLYDKNSVSSSNGQKQSDFVVKIKKNFLDGKKIYEPPYDQQFAIKSDDKTLSFMKISQTNKKDDEFASMKMNKVKNKSCGEVTCTFRKINSKDDFLQFPESSSSPRQLYLKNMKNTQHHKGKCKSSKKHSKEVSKSQSLDLRSTCVQISKKIIKLVDSTKPRFCYGHKSCVDIRMRVPGNMGWLWNTRETLGKLKPQIGWKPGAISRNVWNLLEDAKVERTSEDMRDRSLTPVRGKKTKTTKRKHLFFPSRHYWGQKAKNNDYQLPPTLHIHRKKGDYYVTFYPINKESINKPEEQQTVKPLQFHIRKNRNLDLLDNSSSAASDMEIEFSPPAVTTRYQKKVDTRDVDTSIHALDMIEPIKEVLPKVKATKKKRKIRKKLEEN